MEAAFLKGNTCLFRQLPYLVLHKKNHGGYRRPGGMSAIYQAARNSSFVMKEDACKNEASSSPFNFCLMLLVVFLFVGMLYKEDPNVNTTQLITRYQCFANMRAGDS